MTGRDRRQILATLDPLVDADRLAAWQQAVDRIHLSEPVQDFMIRLVSHTRENREFPHGLSPRGLLALKRAAQAWAFIEGRDFVAPEDVQAVLPSVAEHRLRGSIEDQGRVHSLTTRLMQAVDVIR